MSLLFAISLHSGAGSSMAATAAAPLLGAGGRQGGEFLGPRKECTARLVGRGVHAEASWQEPVTSMAPWPPMVEVAAGPQSLQEPPYFGSRLTVAIRIFLFIPLLFTNNPLFLDRD
jgi:hypothetical protein